MNDLEARPAFSIAIASWSGPAAIIRCLESVLPQAGSAEVIVALPGETGAAEELERRFPAARFVCGGRDASVFQLRSLAVRVAGGSFIALLEDHSTVCPGWAVQLRQARAAGKTIVGGPIENDPDASVYDWALYLVEYGGYMPPLREGEARMLSGANIAYDREALGSCRNVWRSVFYETDVNAALIRSGHTLHMLPQAAVRSRLRMPIRKALAHLYQGGVHFGRFRRRGSFARPLWMLGAPAILLILLFRIIRFTGARQPAHLLQVILGMPCLILLLGAWSAGEAVGLFSNDEQAIGS
jgi:hypothetical protein